MSHFGYYYYYYFDPHTHTHIKDNRYMCVCKWRIRVKWIHIYIHMIFLIIIILICTFICTSPTEIFGSGKHCRPKWHATNCDLCHVAILCKRTTDQPTDSPKKKSTAKEGEREITENREENRAHHQHSHAFDASFHVIYVNILLWQKRICMIYAEIAADVQKCIRMDYFRILTRTYWYYICIKIIWARPI